MDSRGWKGLEHYRSEIKEHFSLPGNFIVLWSAIIEIINNTRGGIVIFLTEKKRERVFWGANSSPGCRARR